MLPTREIQDHTPRDLRPTQRARSCTTALMPLRQRCRARADASSGHAVWPAMRSGEHIRAHATTLATPQLRRLLLKSDNVTLRDTRPAPLHVSPSFFPFLFTEPCCLKRSPELSPICRGVSRTTAQPVPRPIMSSGPRRLRLCGPRPAPPGLISPNRFRWIEPLGHGHPGEGCPTCRTTEREPRRQHQHKAHANSPRATAPNADRSYPQHIHRPPLDTDRDT